MKYELHGCITDGAVDEKQRDTTATFTTQIQGTVPRGSKPARLCEVVENGMI